MFTVEKNTAGGVYDGIVVYSGEKEAFRLRSGLDQDCAVVLAVARHLRSDQNPVFTDGTRVEVPSAKAHDLNEIEKAFYSGLDDLLSLPEGCAYPFFTIPCILPLYADGSERIPHYSVTTEWSSGGKYTARGALYSLGVTPPLYAGDGVTIRMYSDSYPATVCSVSKSGKTVTVKKDRVEVVSGSMYDGSAVYAFHRNPDGPTVTLRLRKDGKYYPSGSSIPIGLGRHRYHDPHF